MKRLRVAITRLAASVVALAFLTMPCHAEMYTVNGDTGDYSVYARQLNQGDPLTNVTTFTANTVERIGFGGNSGSERGTVLFGVFELPVLDAQEIVAAATASFYCYQKDSPSFNVDLWGTGFATSTAVRSANSYYFNLYDTDLVETNVKLQDNLLTPTSAVGTASTSSEALVSYIQGFYNANPGYSGGSYVFLRLNADGGFKTSPIGYRVYTANNGTNIPILSLTTTLVPEPSSAALLAAALIGLMAYAWRRRK